MVTEFTLADQDKALAFYKSRRSALARIEPAKQMIYIFTPASASIGHPTGQVFGLRPV